eukprot:1159112-Pelagomonas_calceolata.AAC.2
MQRILSDKDKSIFVPDTLAVGSARFHVVNINISGPGMSKKWMKQMRAVLDLETLAMGIGRHQVVNESMAGPRMNEGGKMKEVGTPLDRWT